MLVDILERAILLGWTDIIPRQNRRSITVGCLGKPKGYQGPHIRIREDRLTSEYCPPSHCISYVQKQ
jgi:hypothetical protein